MQRRGTEVNEQLTHQAEELGQLRAERDSNLTKLKHFEGTAQRAQQESDKLRAEVQALHTRMQKSDIASIQAKQAAASEAEKQRVEIIELRNKIRDLESDAQHAKTSMSKHPSDASSRMKRRLSSEVTDHMSSQSQELGRLKEERDVAQFKVKQLEGTTQRAQIENEKLRAEVAALNTKMQTSNIGNLQASQANKAEIEKLRGELVEARNKIRDVQSEAQFAKQTATADVAAKTKHRLSTEATDHLSQQAQEIGRLRIEKESAEAKVRELTNALQHAKQECDKFHAEAQALQQKVDKSNITSLQAKRI